ncbi:MAG: hypothetical protein ACXVXB_12400 [Nocardioidaceae bacterium]
MTPSVRLSRSGGTSGSRVFLHVGAPLTGTTLRSTLARHRPRLSRQGVLYPASHAGADASHLEALRDALDLVSPAHRPSTGAWDRFAQGARDWRRGTVVLSHDLFAEATPEQVARIAGSFGRAEVHVVYTPRDLARQIPRAWQAWVQRGGTAGFATFVEHLVARDGHRTSARFWRAHDLGGVLARWGAFVPAERVHVLPVPGGSSPWTQFTRTTGIDDRRLRVTDDGGPDLRPLAATEVLRLLSVQTGEPVAAEVSALLDDVHGPLPAVPHRHRSWLEETEQAQLAAVEAGGYDVVGDLPALRHDPAALAPDDDQVHPRADDVVAVQTRLLAHTLAGGAVPRRTRAR